MKKVKKKDLLKTIKMLGKINYDLARSDILEIERLNEIIENIKTAHDNVVRATQENEIILTDFMIEKIKTNSFCHTFENGIEVRFFYKKNDKNDRIQDFEVVHDTKCVEIESFPYTCECGEIIEKHSQLNTHLITCKCFK